MWSRSWIPAYLQSSGYPPNFDRRNQTYDTLRGRMRASRLISPVHPAVRSARSARSPTTPGRYRNMSPLTLTMCQLSASSCAQRSMSRVRRAANDRGGQTFSTGKVIGCPRRRRGCHAVDNAHLVVPQLAAVDQDSVHFVADSVQLGRQRTVDPFRSVDRRSRHASERGFPPGPHPCGLCTLDGTQLGPRGT
jgi:hypothetical protein